MTSAVSSTVACECCQHFSSFLVSSHFRLIYQVSLLLFIGKRVCKNDETRRGGGPSFRKLFKNYLTVFYSSFHENYLQFVTLVLTFFLKGKQQVFH